MSGRPEQPLRRQLLLLFATGLLPLALFAAWNMRAAIVAHRAEVERSALSLTRALASAVDGELEGSRASLRSLSLLPALTEGDLRQLHLLSQKAVQARPSWLAVILTDADGRVLLRSSRPFGAPGAEPVVDPDSLRLAVAQRRPVLGSLAVGSRGNLAFAVRLPVLREGQVAYVLSAALQPDRLVELLRRQQLPEGWTSSVFDGQGQRVARSTEDFRPPRAQPVSDAPNRLPPGWREMTGHASGADGGSVYLGVSRIGTTDWTVSVEIPTALLDAPLQRTLVGYVVGIVLSLGLSLALALYVARRVSRPIRAIRDQAVRLGEGQPLQLGPSGITELDQMGQALQKAAAQRAEAASEREDLLASLRQALQRAGEAAQAKDQFLAVLGHELRNPLAPMVTALQLLDRKAGPDTDRERLIMRRQLQHMRRLVDDLLDISRITRGALVLQREPVDLRTVLERAIEAVPDHPGLRLPDALPPAVVRGDETRLVQAVTNLLVNALRFSPQAPVTVDLALAGGEACIVVQDEGTGMDAGTLARVFEPFYQAEQPVARAAGGLGLGLAIVHSIVAGHGGRVAARSDGPGRGSRFEIWLPLADAGGG
ncbi:sensor histidine kinase [Aquabacterium sp. J223]|uniref:sensor histidine kinase n=1 Tax=Aquabacterium sp. J223 TaxID=2898431 RepID=UPI0021ADBCBE|nr:sensor histidine kinase [Aquabacterium sp. J223]UUX94443.1 sensor histidine kinase [Aquabacterium sp. J223]